MLNIIIPTWREEEYLPLLLCSLKAQSFQDFEIIVADANSDDATRSIALAAGCQIVEGGLPSVGRNRGAAAARGDWLLFLDADVVLPEEFIEESLKEIEERQLAVATAPIKFLSGNKIDRFFGEFYNFYARLTEHFSPHAPGFCIFCRKEIHQKINGFNEAIRLAEDHDYVVRASRHGKFGVLNKSFMPVSPRRFDKDGRFKIAVKYLAVETHRLFLGRIETDFFNYRFGHYKENAPLKKNLE